MDALLHREASRIYLWKVYSIAQGEPGFYRSTITGPTRHTAIVIVLQCLPIIARVLARRGPDSLIGFRLGSGAIRHGRLAGLCTNGIHDSAFRIAFSDSCPSRVVNHESASAPLTTVVHECYRTAAVRGHTSKTILATAGTQRQASCFEGYYLSRVQPDLPHSEDHHRFLHRENLHVAPISALATSPIVVIITNCG